MTSNAVHRNSFRGRRLLINFLRTVHVVAMVGCGAGILKGAPFADWNGYAFTLLVSGLGILFLDRWANPDYFRQLDGLAVLAKLFVFATMAWLFGSVTAFWLVLVISVLVAHAPGHIRHWHWRWLRN
jgi:hypothetical protein